MNEKRSAVTFLNVLVLICILVSHLCLEVDGVLGQPKKMVSKLEKFWTTSQPHAVRDLGVNATHVVNLEMCRSRWKLMEKWANYSGAQIQRWRATSFAGVDLKTPPIPLVNVPKHKRVTSGQVACSATHLKIWRHAWKHGYKRVLVLEDDVVLTNSIMDNLAQYLSELDEFTSQSGKQWHWITLRKVTLQSTLGEKIFLTFKDGRSIYTSAQFWGSAAYVLSREGIAWLLSHLTYYQHPLDVQISEFQRTRPDFIVLSLCKSGSNFERHCPENTISFTREMKEECSGSASQAGSTKFGTSIPSLWRHRSNKANGVSVVY
eukprot:CAMPEP_0182442456 /NCGR_PEP_ID=MMETSP1172-20130603/1370_1 /TAXON_ID=708627 /ORGANISM="Timspurckia oligopyrenoides, Strain CCMP3278" /LENGTH=318 /DNA_ID=CAMNT_0024637325 /DNA_START=26 /DNA_END=982 /DNA_ORIENTATION=+